MKMIRSLATSAAILGLVAGTVSPAFAQHRVKRHATRVVAQPIPAGYVAQEQGINRDPTPVVVGAAVGLGTGLLVANSSGVASAFGASTTVGAGFGFGAIGGVSALILYCAIAKPHRQCL